MAGAVASDRHVSVGSREFHGARQFVPVCWNRSLSGRSFSKLPPEFTRAERLDGVFFLDVPTTSERDLIWLMYRKHFDIPETQSRPDDTSWTRRRSMSCPLP